MAESIDVYLLVDYEVSHNTLPQFNRPTSADLSSGALEQRSGSIIENPQVTCMTGPYTLHRLTRL
jgi:hypothetical protein